MKESLLNIFRHPSFGWRTLILLISLLIATSVYIFIVDFYDPDSNVLSSLKDKVWKKNQLFYSGSNGGFYISIGEALEDELKKKKYSIELKNEETKGGYENAIKVLANKNSYGLIQEETLRKQDFIREHIDYVTPLYMERMHILYRNDRIKGKSKFSDPNIIISTKLNADTRRFFSNAIVSTGPVGSSGRIIASYILSYINNKINLPRKTEHASKTVAYTTDEGLRELKEGKIDLVFLHSGAPVKSVRDALDNENIKLMSLEPSVVAALNKDYDLNYRMSDFKDKYKDVKSFKKSEHISTLGSYAFLIASNYVSDSDKWELIQALDEVKEQIKVIAEFPTDAKNESTEQFQLDEFKFKESVSAENEKTFFAMIRSVILFVISVSTTTALIWSFFVWVISVTKHTYYFRRIYQIVDRNIHPIKDNARNYLYNDIDNLDEDLSKLMEITKRLHKDYQTGGITETHYAFIVRNLDTAKKKLEDDLYRRLKMLFEEGNSISSDLLEKFFLSGFINSEQYFAMKNS